MLGFTLTGGGAGVGLGGSALTQGVGGKYVALVAQLLSLLIL